MADFEKRGKVWSYRYVDENGRRRRRNGCSDLAVTKQLAAKVEADVARIKAGLIDPRALAYRDHEARPLADHLADWHAYLTAKGSTRQHALLSRNRVRRLIDLAGVARVSELVPSRIQAAIKAIREGAEGVSLRSAHHYTRAVKG